MAYHILAFIINDMPMPHTTASGNGIRRQWDTHLAVCILDMVTSVVIRVTSPAMY